MTLREVNLEDFRPLSRWKLLTLGRQIQDWLRRGFQVTVLGRPQDLAYFSLVNGVPLDDEPAEIHRPVMLQEVLDFLQARPGAVIVDATAGAGGHTEALARTVGPEGRIIALDRDPEMVRLAQKRLRPYPWVQVLHADFARLPEVLQDLGVQEIHGVLFDLGLSSYHLDQAGRGFTFRRPEPLDLRFDPSEGRPASWYLNRAPQPFLEAVFRLYGEEPLARRLARAIVEARERHPLETTDDLNALIDRWVPVHRRARTRARVYQALRILVNRELDRVAEGLAHALNLLSRNGRLVILSYHSLEDRLAKALKHLEGVEPLTKKPVRPQETEIRRNPRARSAKLRAYRKTGAMDRGEVVLAYLRSFVPHPAGDLDLL